LLFALLALFNSDAVDTVHSHFVSYALVMPLTEADYEDLRAEANAEPERFNSWDPNQRFRTEYANLHPEDYPDLHPEAQRKPEDLEEDANRDENEIEQIPTISDASSASETRYEGVRARPAARSHPSTYRYDTEMHRSETHRINGPLGKARNSS
jgi:DHA1 family multidrug resistance protein-like MFS transporter